MTLTRYQIRNEYGLADKEIYSDKEDAEVLLEGSSMAGLVGLLRQLGDLAEFAGEVFNNLHEELMTTAARGQGLAVRLQQLEAEVPNSVEIPILSQTDHSTFFYDPGKHRIDRSCNISGLEWHSTLKTEEHLISPHKLPHCIIDSYEECRGPPQLYLLDKFDVDGSGSCLKRYSDSSLLKTLAASQLSKDERPSKPKKKASHISNGERTLGDSQTSHAKLNQLFLMDHAEDPEITVKLKRRHLNVPPPINSSYGTGYMEKFVKNSLPYCERVHETLDQSSSAMETDEVTTCNVRVDLSTPSLVYPSNGETRKEREMEAIADDEREGGGAIVCVERSSSVNNDTYAPPASTDTEADKDDVTQTGVLASNVLHHSTEEGVSEGGTKDVQTNDVEDDHSQHIFSVETGSEISLTGLVEDQFSSITNQETEKEPDCHQIQNQHISTFDNFEDLSLDVDAVRDSAVPREDEIISQDGYSVNTEDAGHVSTLEISSEVETMMLDTPKDVHTGNITPSASSCQEDTLADSDVAEISSDSGKEDPQPMSIIADGSSELEVQILDTQSGGTVFAGDNQARLNDKVSETVPEVDLETIGDAHECLPGTQECFSPEYHIQTHSQGGQESQSETDSENTTAEAAAESLPPQDVPLGVQCSTSEETLTCNENEAEVEALNAPHQGDITSLNGNYIPESVLSMDPTDQENCLDVPMAPFSTSLHVTPQEDLEITPPLPPLPPTQWWMGKLVDSVKQTETQFSPVPYNGNNSFYIHRDENTHNGLVQGTEAQDQSEASVTADESHNTDVDPVEAVLISAKTTLNEQSKATEEEQYHSESVAWESLLTPEATPEAESIQGLEALEWFSQNLKEHTNPNLTKLEEKPQLDHPLEPPGGTEGDNKSYEKNEKVEKLPRDKESLVLGIDRSMLRKVSERNRTQLGARVDENDSLLEIIRSKSFNLRPADASVRHNFQVAAPITNLKVAAILEKANSLRHAMAGSDDDHDSDSWKLKSNSTHLKMEARKQDNEHIFRSLYPSVPIPDKLTLPEFVLQGVEEFTENVAFVEAVTGKSVTYGDVVRDTKRLAKALTSLGLRKGQVMVVVLPNVAEYGIIALGIMSAGGVFSGANPTALVSEIKKQVEASGASGIITDSTNFEKVKALGLPVIVLGEEKIEGAVNWKDLLEAGDRSGDNNREKILQTDLCALPFSSGTTGLQKGVMLTHRNLIANLCSTLFSVRSEMIGQIVTLGLIPFFHIYGIVGICCATMKNKGKVVAMSRYDLRLFLNALITHEVLFAPIVPPIILNLVKNPIVDEFDLSKLKLRSVMTAAAPLAPELLTAFEAKFPNVQAYGLTEHSCITLTHGDPDKGQGIAKRNSVGFILPNLEVKFIDPDTGRSLPKNTSGELCVRSQCVMQGYFENKEETEKTIDEEGWLHTGDVGYIDDDGDIFIVDRIKELIKYKGFQVAPAELEAILLTHPSVEDVAVVPLPDEEAGEIPVACVVMNPKAKEKEEDILSFVAANVAHYKKIRAVHFVDSIPKSLSGKIMRRLLRDNILSIKKTLF
ncbi:unnamed protein product [Brassica oleracea]